MFLLRASKEIGMAWAQRENRIMSVYKVEGRLLFSVF